MDFIYNALMGSVKTPQERQTQTPEKKEGSDSFQKLLDQKQGGETAVSGQEQPQQTGGVQPQEAEAVQPVQDPKELEKQMVLAAAMAAMQNPQIAGLVADIAEETPQILSDPNWQEGFVPIGYDDGDGYRIVHWMQPEAAAENLKELNEAAGDFIQETQTQDTAPEAQVQEFLPETEAPVAEVRPEREIPVEVETESESPKEAPAEAPVFQEVEAVPVKVGEAPAAQETKEAQDIGEQIGQKLIQITSVTAESGGQSITVQLDPANLGKVQIEVSLSEDGTLRVSLTAENGRTQSLLSRHGDDLAAILGKYAREEVRVEVPRQEESQQQNFYDGHQGHEGQQQRQERRREQPKDGEDFLHQLRLGLVPGDLL